MDYDPQRVGACPRRTVRPPGWMADYEGYTVPAAPMLHQPQPREGYVEMTSFTQTPVSLGAVGQTPVLPSTSRGFIDIVQQLQKDNRRLQLVVTDMRRQIDRYAATMASISLKSAKPPESHISADDTWVPTSLANKSPFLQQGQHNAPSIQDGAEEWPVPPPPVFLPCDYSDQQEV
ncbi:hypothetical protein XENORESO_008825 [Xenotaenia resolanae]|uniref:Uncharacterized protein n=1 Tax=Xenotaenia resolanae TaxID=208358 RepID=A0ABV0W7H5_9TELE